MSAIDQTVNSAMFGQIARKALRAGIAVEGHRIGLSALDEEAASLAYALAEVARRRVDDVIAERDLPSATARHDTDGSHE